MSKKRIDEPINPDYFYLGKRLSEIRNDLNLSQAEASKMLGIPQSTYAGYETGKRKISLTRLRDIAAAYGVKVDYLLGVSFSVDQLTEDERTLIEIYRTDPSAKNTLDYLIAYRRLLKKEDS